MSQKIANSNLKISWILTLSSMAIVISGFGLAAFVMSFNPTPPVTPRTTQSFIQPNCTDNVTVSVTDTTGMSPGLNIYIENGGYYTVLSVIDVHYVVLMNTCVVGNEPVGTIVGLTPVSVRMAGATGTAGPAGATSAGSRSPQTFSILSYGSVRYNNGNGMPFTSDLSLYAVGVSPIVVEQTGKFDSVSIAVANAIFTGLVIEFWVFPSTRIGNVTFEGTEFPPIPNPPYGGPWLLGSGSTHPTIRKPIVETTTGSLNVTSGTQVYVRGLVNNGSPFVYVFCMGTIVV